VRRPGTDRGAQRVRSERSSSRTAARGEARRVRRGPPASARGLELGDRTARENDDRAVSAALDTARAVAEWPVERRRRDSTRPRRPRRGSLPVARPRSATRPPASSPGADAETLKRGKNGEGPEMQDAFLRLATEVEAEPSNRLPVRQPRAGRGLVASFGHRGSHVLCLDRCWLSQRDHRDRRRGAAESRWGVRRSSRIDRVCSRAPQAAFFGGITSAREQRSRAWARPDRSRSAAGAHRRAAPLTGVGSACCRNWRWKVEYHRGAEPQPAARLGTRPSRRCDEHADANRL
jgi:hypothetical protein